jgi:hypothetical protein
MTNTEPNPSPITCHHSVPASTSDVTWLDSIPPHQRPTVWGILQRAYELGNAELDRQAAATADPDAACELGAQQWTIEKPRDQPRSMDETSSEHVGAQGSMGGNTTMRPNSPLIEDNRTRLALQRIYDLAIQRALEAEAARDQTEVLNNPEDAMASGGQLDETTLQIKDDGGFNRASR